MPLQELVLNGQTWFPTSGGGSPLLAGRDGLVAGIDKPTAETTGVPAGTTLEGVYPTAGQYIITLSPGTYTNKMFWGQVKPSYVSGAEYRFENCWFASADFNWSIYTNNLVGLISNSPNGSTAMPHVTLVDCTFDPNPWFDGHPLRPAGWTPGPNAVWNRGQTAGFHGGNFTMLRCHLNGVQDGVNYVGWGESSSCLVELSWIHNNFFANDWYGPSDGRTHSDIFQFNTGPNVTLRGNVLGGARDMTGYRTWPGGSNTGDDAWNAAIMLKQEASNDSNRRLENILIEENWIYGGTAGINFPYNPTYPNLFTTTIIRNNRFGVRGTGWRGSATGPGTYDTGNGWYIIRSENLQATISGNIIESTGAAVPIQNG